MATGELVESRENVFERPADMPREMGYAAAEMPGGRVSIAQEHYVPANRLPFSTRELSLLDEALTVTTRDTGLVFSVYLGDLGDEPRAYAESLVEGSEQADRSVLIAVSPGQRKVEVVTGSAACERIPDRTCKLAVMNMVASFKEGDLIRGLVSGIRMLGEQAGG